MAIGLSRKIYSSPELSFSEYKAVQLICQTLTEAGFEIEGKVAGLETAFSATHPARSNGPTVAFLAEYDALPNLGHACGHNLIAGAAVAAALAVGSVKEQLPGTFKLIGTPAEETGGGKIIMAEKGVFEDLDVVMMVHPGNRNGGSLHTLTLVPLKITFHGKASHASATPEAGVNALSAVLQTFYGVHMLREHFLPEASVHGIITKGGERTNIVPDLTECQFSIRAPTVSYRDELVQKVKNCAKGAALTTGCTVEFGYYGLIYEPMKRNVPLEETFIKNFACLGVEIDEAIPQGKGSTDAANVSQVAPTLHGNFRIASKDIKAHTKEFADAAVSNDAMQGMLNAAKALAMTAVEIMLSPELMQRIREDFDQLKGGDSC